MTWYEWGLLGWAVLAITGLVLDKSGALDEIAKAKKGKKMKYKVGDKVRIVDKWNTRTIKDLTGSMDKWLGKVMTVRKVEGSGHYRMAEDWGEGTLNRGWIWNEYMIAGLAKETNEKIVVTTDGKTTLARYYEGKKVVHTAEAICSPDDTFDFGTGAKLATERLLEKMKPQPPKFKVGDVVKIVGNIGRRNGKQYHYLRLGTCAIVLQENCGDALILAGVNTVNDDGSQIVYVHDVERVEIK